MKKICIICISLLLVLVLIGCAPNGTAPATGDQDAFLSSMAKGIKNRLSLGDGDSVDSLEEQASFHVSLVECELKELEKYENVVFPDEAFDMLAHQYIDACKMQMASTEYFRNEDLYNSLWDGGRTVRAGIIIYFYEKYDLDLTAEEAESYKPTVTYTVVEDTDFDLFGDLDDNNEEQALNDEAETIKIECPDIVEDEGVTAKVTDVYISTRDGWSRLFVYMSAEILSVESEDSFLVVNFDMYDAQDRFLGETTGLYEYGLSPSDVGKRVNDSGIIDADNVAKIVCTNKGEYLTEKATGTSDVSKTEKAFHEIANITPDMLELDEFGGYYYNGRRIDVTDAMGHLIIDPSSFYNYYGMGLDVIVIDNGENFSDLAQNSNILKGIMGETCDTPWADFKETALYYNSFISEHLAPDSIMEVFENADSVEGTFDYENRSYIFTITDTKAFAEELQITEEMLGYILQYLASYAPKVEFNNMSVYIDLTIKTYSFD